MAAVEEKSITTAEAKAPLEEKSINVKDVKLSKTELVKIYEKNGFKQAHKFTKEELIIFLIERDIELVVEKPSVVYDTKLTKSQLFELCKINGLENYSNNFI